MWMFVYILFFSLSEHGMRKAIVGEPHYDFMALPKRLLSPYKLKFLQLKQKNANEYDLNSKRNLTN